MLFSADERWRIWHLLPRTVDVFAQNITDENQLEMLFNGSCFDIR